MTAIERAVDPAHIRYIEQTLCRQAEIRSRVTDDDLLGKEGVLYQVYGAHQIDLSAEVKRRTGIWSAEPIVKGSAAANALVRLAASILAIDPKELPKEKFERVVDLVTKRGVSDVPGSIDHAVCLLADDLEPFIG